MPSFSSRRSRKSWPPAGDEDPVLAGRGPVLDDLGVNRDRFLDFDPNLIVGPLSGARLGLT